MTRFFCCGSYFPGYPFLWNHFHRTFRATPELRCAPWLSPWLWMQWLQLPGLLFLVEAALATWAVAMGAAFIGHGAQFWALATAPTDDHGPGWLRDPPPTPLCAEQPEKQWLSSCLQKHLREKHCSLLDLRQCWTSHPGIRCACCTN